MECDSPSESAVKLSVGGLRAPRCAVAFLRGGTLQPVSLPGGTIPSHDGRGPHHLGFGISATAYDSWRQYLREKGVKIESEAVWPKGSHSLYFRDPDGHLLELVTPGIWPNY